MDRRKIDCVITSLLIAVSIVILTNDHLVEGGAESALSSMTLPRIVASIMLIISVSIGGRSLLSLFRKSVSENSTIDTSGFFQVALYIGIFVAYWWLMPIFGFLISTPIMMLAIASLLSCENWKAMAVVALIVPTIVFYGSREYLYVYLPTFTLM